MRSYESVWPMKSSRLAVTRRVPQSVLNFELHIIYIFIVHQWRLTRILERGPIPQHGNVIALSRSSGSDPEQYDGNRHKRNAMVCVPTSFAPSITLVALSRIWASATSISNDNCLVFSPEIRIISDEFGVFRPWKALFRFLEITKRCVLSFFKKVGKHTIKIKTCFFYLTAL